MITDGHGNVGFPGFGGISAAQSLAYVAAMQEHGVPVTVAYISDAHDDHKTGLASGPGQTDYVAQLAAYNRAWGGFFTRLADDGITPANTLFVITADEGDTLLVVRRARRIAMESTLRARTPRLAK